MNKSMGIGPDIFEPSSCFTAQSDHLNIFIQYICNTYKTVQHAYFTHFALRLSNKYNTECCYFYNFEGKPSTSCFRFAKSQPIFLTHVVLSLLLFFSFFHSTSLSLFLSLYHSPFLKFYVMMHFNTKYVTHTIAIIKSQSE